MLRVKSVFAGPVSVIRFWYLFVAFLEVNKCFPYSTALPLVFSLKAYLSHHRAHPTLLLIGLGCREGKAGCSPVAPLSHLSPWLGQRCLSQRTGFHAWGTERPRNLMWGWGQGKAEMDSTLAFHQAARKASGNLFRESNLGLSPE